jgi:predicted Ser/Thr protein kinase
MTTPSFASEFPELARALEAQFRIERELGRGGMGVVYLARDLKLDRMVALKVLPAVLAAHPVTRERFLREARTAARLAHPNVVPIYRADEAGGTAFFAMAFVDGESVGDRLRARGPFLAADAIPILRDVAWALAYAHASGVVHRDVKPENILLERQSGRVMVTDFGIAHVVDPTGTPLTQDGTMLGTLHYMSPEQAEGRALDGRSDLYSLGVVAYQMLSGRLPFDDVQGAGVLVAHLSRPAPSLRQVAPSVPAAIVDVVDRALAKDPAARPQTGEAFADALQRAFDAAPASQRHPSDPGIAGLPERISEAQAAAIWRRAAQLQADALRRLDAQRELQGFTAAEATVDRIAPTGAYKLTDVAAAAAEAGISRQYVSMALAEMPRGAALQPSTETMGVAERVATRYLGTEERSLAVTVAIAAPPARVLRALGTVLQQLPYALKLRDSIGGHPLDGGVVVFDLPGVVVGAGGALASQMNWYWMGTHQQLEAKQVQVTLRDDGARGTEVTMTCDLRPGVRRNVLASKWIAGMGGATAGVFSTLTLAKVLGTAALAMTGAGGGIAVATVAASLWWYRWLYVGVLDKSRKEMRGALEGVAASVQSETIFGAPVPSTAPPDRRLTD